MKPLLVYAALVGVPVAGLAAVLHAGRGLHAPPSIAGQWQLEWPRGMRRAPTAGELEGTQFTVSQSGIHVALTLFRREYRGELRGDSLVAASGGRPGMSGACRDAPHAVLRARIDTAAVPPRMEFTLQAPRPPGCDGPHTAVRIDRTFDGPRR